MNKKSLVFFVIILIIIITSLSFILNNNLKDTIVNNQESVFGVWWWDNRIDDSYLEFAEENGITEIYYYVSTFNDKIANFVKKANSKNIKVYWLTGEYEWIEDYGKLQDKMNDFLAFQEQTKNLFSGIHFDIEPHQYPDFDKRREEILYNFVSLTYKIRKDYKDIFIEYDIPCWLDDMITYNNETKPTFEHIFNNSDRITLMSYRDSAEKIYNFAKTEIEYAKKVNKQVNLGVETQDVNDDLVTFFEEGKNYMNNELNKLRNLIPQNFGIAIHYIESWYELKE